MQKAEGKELDSKHERSDHARARPGSVRYRRTGCGSSCYGGHGSRLSQDDARKKRKKMTNEANMFLKTKGRVYKRSQTNPILCVGNFFALEAVQYSHFRSGRGALGTPAGGIHIIATY